jgi:hypothetical protein
MQRFIVRPIPAPVLVLFVLGGCGCSRGDTDAPADTKPPVLIQPTVTTSALDDGLPPVTDSDPQPTTAPEPAETRQCDPNYTPCVPVASDVDCAGGKGNGPSYVAGPVRVIKDDPYRLDSDHDGVGCES